MNENTLINAGVEAGLMTLAQLATWRIAARSERLPVLEIALREQRLPQMALTIALAKARQLPHVDPEQLSVHDDDLARWPPSLSQRHLLLPMRQGNERYLVIGDPDDRLGLEAARRALSHHLPLALADADALAAVLRLHTGHSGGHTLDHDDPVRLFDRVMKEAWLRRASDIHIEPNREAWRIRLRADGMLHGWGGALPKHIGEALVSRIKVLAGMDITEARAAQDGGMRYRVRDWVSANAETDLRVASVPTRFGERLTLRVLRQDAQGLLLDDLGMPPAILTRFKTTLAHPHGIILVTGPTGSGKSTTLYAALREINANQFNILTVEDPVEQTLPGLTQVQATEKCGFADTLRSFLRHDPDIIMVGEIRDADTAATAVKAAMTGHLVLSTLHTNHALAAVTRLADIGCERFLVADTLVAVFAQRLVRRLCTACCTHRPATAQEQALLHSTAPLSLAEPVGCPQCMDSGYKGRIGIYEALWMDTLLADAVVAGATERDLARTAKHWYRLADDARAKVIAGQTSFSEVRSWLMNEDEQ